MRWRPPFLDVEDHDPDRARLFALGALLRLDLDRACRRLDLTPQQAMALMSIGAAEGTPMRGVADSLGADASNVTGLVDRLEGAGLVERVAEPDDRRVKRLRLTAAGRSRYDELHRLVCAQPGFLQALTPDQLRAFRDAADRMIEAADHAAG